MPTGISKFFIGWTAGSKEPRTRLAALWKMPTWVSQKLRLFNLEIINQIEKSRKLTKAAETFDFLFLENKPRWAQSKLSTAQLKFSLGFSFHDSGLKFQIFGLLFAFKVRILFLFYVSIFFVFCFCFLICFLLLVLFFCCFCFVWFGKSN